jgi:hypothetical protein
MPMGQLREQMPHWTQRAESGTTWASTSAARRVRSGLKMDKNFIPCKSRATAESYGQRSRLYYSEITHKWD